MDPVTHLLSGALWSRVGFAQRWGWAATATLMVGAILPDIDTALLLWGQIPYLTHHRGLTHSLLGGAVLGILLGLLANRLGRFGRPGLFAAMGVLGVYTHILLDLVTSFGTQVFYPFSRERYALDQVFIVDPIFTALFLVPLLLAWRLSGRWGRGIALTGWGLVAGYLLFTAVAHELAADRTAEAMREALIQPKRVEVLPQPFSPFRWRGIGEWNGSFFETSIDLLAAEPLRFQAYPRGFNGEAVFPEGEELVEFYRWFSRFPVVAARVEGDRRVLEYSDLRFQPVFQRRPFILRLILDPEGRLLSTSLH